MSSGQLLALGWLAHIVLCHFLYRRVRDNSIRAILTIVPCILLIYVACRNLPQFDMASVLVASNYWMMSLRIIQMTLFSPQEVRRFHSFLFNVFWTLFPVIPSDSREKQLPVIFDLASAGIKLFLNHWIFQLIIYCQPGGVLIKSTLVALQILMASFIFDLMIAFVRLVTRDKYTLLSISNYPLMSTSLREFWGRRYNRLASTAFNECIFKPVRHYLSSPLMASMVTFTISGLLHAHGALIAIHDVQAACLVFGFFFLHGILCCVESYLRIRLPAPLGWLMTYLVLFVTLPLCVGPYLHGGPAFFANNPPQLFNASWLPKLPIPSSCRA